MLNANKLMPRGGGLAAVLLKRAATVELDWDVRQKSRFDITDSQGRHLGVFLPRGTAVRGGDVLVVEDGSLVKVIAAPQPVLVVTHCAQHGSAFDLMRAAYHLGNRHVPIELTPTHLKIEPDHVLAAMLRAMHLIVHEADEPFEPENGAYGAHGAGGHGHGHGHHSHDGNSHGDHGHAHAPSPGRTPVGPVLHADAYGGAPHGHGDDHGAHDPVHGGHDHAQCGHDHSH